MEKIEVLTPIQVNFQFNNNGYFSPTIYNITLDSIPKIGDHFYFDSSLKNYKISDLVEWKSLLDDEACEEYNILDGKLNEISKKGKNAVAQEKDELRVEYQSILGEMMELLDDSIPIWNYNKVIAIYRNISADNKAYINSRCITIVLGKDEEYADQFLK